MKNPYLSHSSTRTAGLLALLTAALASGCGVDGAGSQEVTQTSSALCASTQFTTGLTATASSTENAGTPASAAIDGNATSRWSSAFADPQWLRVDLGQQSWVSSVTISWETASAADYQLQLSNDGSTWSTVKTITAAAAGARTDTLTGLSSNVGRYVRVYGTRRNTTYGYSIYEIKIYGDANSNCNSSGGRSIASNLEAETNDGMSGVQYETTSDTGGGQNAGWIDPNDYIQWSINVPTTGNYTVTTRSATVAASTLQIAVDGTTKATMNLSSTGGYQTWASFVSPAFNITAGTHTLRVTFTSASQNLNWIKVTAVSGAVCGNGAVEAGETCDDGNTTAGDGCSATCQAENKVTLTTSGVDDYLYVFVDGVRRPVYSAANYGTNLDVTNWFGNGANAVRLELVDTGAPASFSFQLRVNGALAINESCNTTIAPCSTLPAGSGIVFDKSYSINVPFGGAPQSLTVSAPSGGKLYINNQYTGLTVPATLSLPQGTYTLGVGTSSEVIGAHTGQYREKVVTLGNASQSVDLSAATIPAANHIKYAILPIRTTIYGTNGANGTAVLTDADITNMNTLVINTREQYVKPFSYGLSTWDVTVLPTVENTPAYDANGSNPPDTDRLLNDAGLTAYKTQYDEIIYLYSMFKADGSSVIDSPCCYWGGGQGIWFNNSFPRSGDTSPNYYLLHESLHTYDSYQSGRLWMYAGADGVHGMDEHGYNFNDDGEPDFVSFYRAMFRGQVAEVNTMRVGTAWTGARPTTADLWVGDFDTIRQGLHWNP